MKCPRPNEVGAINSTAKEAVEAQLSAVKQITAAYDIEVEADYGKLTDSDALEILSRINAATQLCIDSEADRVMQELDAARGKLPVAAIKEVREHADIFVPLLMRSLQQAILRVSDGGELSRWAAFSEESSRRPRKHDPQPTRVPVHIYYRVT